MSLAGVLAIGGAHLVLGAIAYLVVLVIQIRRMEDMEKHRYRVTVITHDLKGKGIEVHAFDEEDAQEKAKNNWNDEVVNDIAVMWIEPAWVAEVRRIP